jgi:hypothetical protein
MPRTYLELSSAEHALLHIPVKVLNSPGTGLRNLLLLHCRNALSLQNGAVLILHIRALTAAVTAVTAVAVILKLFCKSGMQVSALAFEVPDALLKKQQSPKVMLKDLYSAANVSAVCWSCCCVALHEVL